MGLPLRLGGVTGQVVTHQLQRAQDGACSERAAPQLVSAGLGSATSRGTQPSQPRASSPAPSFPPLASP